MAHQFLFHSVFNKFAIFLIATCAINTWTTAQIASNLAEVTNTATVAAGSEQIEKIEQQERARITQQRTAAETGFETAKEACYQKFAVNTCIAKARAQQREVLADLKRRDVALNDQERKRQGLAQLQKTEEKTAPQRQAEIAAQRDEALAKTAERQTEQAKKQADQKLKLQAAPPTDPDKTPKQAQTPKAVAPKVAKNPRSPEDAATAKALYDKRQLEAAQHRAKVQAQQQGKKPAETLPVPPN